MSVYGFFGKCHENIARPRNFICLWDTFSSKGHGSDRLGSADFIDPVHTGDMGRHQRTRIYRPIRSRRCRHNDFPHSRCLSRNDIHQHTGRIGCFSPGGIDSGSFHSSDLLSENTAIFLDIDPAVPELFFMIGAYIDRCLFHHFHKRRIQHIICSFCLCLCYPDIGCVDIAVVKLFCQSKQSLVPLCPHFVYDIRYNSLIGSVVTRISF